MIKRIVILGSTGSVGTQTLDVVRAHPEEFEVIGLSAHENVVLFDAQVHEFRPRHVLQTATCENPDQALSALASLHEADLIVNAISGHAGLAPTYAACLAGKNIALANKESLVMAGQLIMQTATANGATILPVDSEPAAIWQMLRAAPQNQKLEKVILTASGGPFWKWKREELVNVEAGQALKHPTWKMGEKVSIDSATLMNKAFEILETSALFELSSSQIDVTVHRQSMVHAMIQWTDGNMSAILSPPDMRIPISCALFYPNSFESKYPKLNLEDLHLSFEKPDYSIFKGPRLAHEVLQEGGILPAALCITDEIAVGKFLRGEIPFLGIYDFIESALSNVKNVALSLDAIRELKNSFTGRYL